MTRSPPPIDPDMLGTFEAALGSMPRKRRQIFIAKRLDGMSYREIADVTGLTVRQIERHMAKALAAIVKHTESEETDFRAGLMRRLLRFAATLFGGKIARPSSKHGQDA
jgi:DNA-directed RNA polymerase specialized sigma24 family protein